jgi:hypothetical protein
MKKLLLSVIALTIFFSFHNTTKAQEDLILFHSDSCGYCKQVFNAIEENDLLEILDIYIIETSEDGFKDLFRASLEECGRDPDRGGYPTLYHNGECSVGSEETINTLLTLAGIVENDEEEITTEEETMVEEEIDEEEEVRTLEEVTPIQENQTEVEPRPFSHILMIILGPALLIALGYFMIKKLNL